MCLIYLEEIIIHVKGKQCKHGKMGENNMKREKKKKQMLHDTIPLLITIVMAKPKTSMP